MFVDEDTDVQELLGKVRESPRIKSLGPHARSLFTVLFMTGGKTKGFEEKNGETLVMCVLSPSGLEIMEESVL